MSGGMQKAALKVGGIREGSEGELAGTQAGPAAGDLDKSGIHSITGGPGHEPDDAHRGPWRFGSLREDRGGRTLAEASRQVKLQILQRQPAASALR